MTSLSSAEYAKLESLIEQRCKLTEDNLKLMARWKGTHGTHNWEKELLRAEISRDYRESNQKEHAKKSPTAAEVEAAIATDSRYVTFVKELCLERPEWISVSEQYDAITLRIRFLLKADGYRTSSPPTDPDETDQGRKK